MVRSAARSPRSAKEPLRLRGVPLKGKTTGFLGTSQYVYPNGLAAALLLALLELGPFVSEADGAVEDRCVVHVGREVTQPFELHDLAGSYFG